MRGDSKVLFLGFRDELVGGRAAGGAVAKVCFGGVWLVEQKGGIKIMEKTMDNDPVRGVSSSP